jgi:hypothetical protein
MTAISGLSAKSKNWSRSIHSCSVPASREVSAHPING